MTSRTPKPPTVPIAAVGEAGPVPPRAGPVPASPVPPGSGLAGPRTWTIELPPGLELLNPNHRTHWAARYRSSEALKKATWAMALQARIPHLEQATITVTYQPPDLRHRDADNGPAASLKPCIDGLVAAKVLTADDERYVLSVTSSIGSLYPRGRLVLTITEVGGT